MVHVSDVMRRQFLRVQPEISVTEACRLMSELDEPCAVVVEGEKPIGIVSEKDVVRKIVAMRVNSDEIKIKEIMSTPLVTVGPKESLKNAARLMMERHIRRLPVVENENLLGIITAVDFAKHIGGKKGFLELMAESMAYQSLPPYPV